jgi:plastocyanin
LSHRKKASLAAATLAVLALPASAGAATKIVTAGPPLQKPPPGVPQYADALQFFPKSVSVHAGDTVRWRFFGFHNVVFPKKGSAPPPFAGLSPTLKVTGETDPAGAPFYFDGAPQPIGEPQSVLPQGGKTYTGSQLTGSGLPSSEKFTYKLKFSKTGTYTYYCTIHAGMKATVKVLAASKSVPSTKDDAKRVVSQLDDTISAVKKANSQPDPTGNVVQLGRDGPGFSLLAIFPAQKTVPVGTAVDFRMTPGTGEIHTATFGPPAYLKSVGDGILAPLPGTGTPPTFGVPGAAFFPSQPPPGALVFNGTQNGGYVNTGFLDGNSQSPLPLDNTITFTAPGTYQYICLIHPDMKATITVQ